MRQTKRKIVALGMALSLAFVLVAALLPMGEVEAKTQINTLKFSVDSTMVGFANAAAGLEEDVLAALVKVPDGSLVRPSLGYVTDANGEPLEAGVAVKDGEEYYLFVDLENIDRNNYEFNTDPTVEVTGATFVKWPDGKPQAGSWSANVLVKVKPDASGGGESGGGESGGGESGGGDIPASVPVKDGYVNQTVAPGAAITIGFEKDFSDFNNGTEQGKVYIDGNEVPGQYVNATPGSTIIQIAEEYMKQLSEGAHKMVVKFLDNTEGEASFTVSSSAAASTAANGTSGTASSTAATTTKVTSPKTADVLPIAGIALVFVGATAIGIIAIRRKNL